MQLGKIFVKSVGFESIFCCFSPFFFPIKECALDKLTAMFWFGGKFKWTNNGLDYVGGQGCTIEIDADMISWFDLDDLVVNKVEVKFSLHAI